MSFASMDLSGEVTLGDALNKIRALKVSLQEQEHSYEARIDDLKDELGRVRDEKLQEMKRQRQAAKEREQALQADAEDRANALATLARREVADEVDTLREQLKDAENKAEAAAALLEDLQSNMDQRCDVEERDTGFKDAEVRLFKEKLMQQAEEAHALRLCIERERELHEAERIAWSRSQDQAAEALTAYRQRAAKSELNARWVSAVQQSLQAKDTTVRSTTAAVELLLHLLEELREVYGRIPADAIIHKTLRSSPSVAKATSAGVDVASLLSSGLPSFSKHRASANAFSSSKSRSPDPQTPSPLPQNPAFPIYTEEKREFSEHSGLLHGSPQAHEGVADAQGFALSASPVHAQLALLNRAKQLKEDTEGLIRNSPPPVSARSLSPGSGGTGRGREALAALDRNHSAGDDASVKSFSGFAGGGWDGNGVSPFPSAQKATRTRRKLLPPAATAKQKPSFRQSSAPPPQFAYEQHFPHVPDAVYDVV